MNYLAHAYLSFGDSGILTGNMISDFVKGKKKYNYPQIIQKGIGLHRQIDEYTDCHPQTAKAKSFFRDPYRLYSGPFVDIVFDHFLARDADQFQEYGGLQHFTSIVYDALGKEWQYFPAAFSYMFPYMKRQDWLWNYQFKEGIRRSFGGLVRRAAYLNESAKAYELFQRHYEELEDCFSAFFPQLKTFAYKNFKQLISS